jgi:hypothetical protein
MFSVRGFSRITLSRGAQPVRVPPLTRLAFGTGKQEEIAKTLRLAPHNC